MRGLVRGRADGRSGPVGRDGFTLVELLLVMLIIGILAQIALPNYRGLTTRARAVDLIADIDVVEQAARSYQADLHSWPPETPAGAIPPGLEPFLPGGFGFVGEDFTLDWESISIPGGLPGDPGTTLILGVGVVTDNTELGAALVELMGDAGWYLVGNRYVRIVDRQ